MPELPEVETIRRQLGRVLPGQEIKSVDVRREKSFVGNPQDLEGRRIEEIGRKGKMLIFELSGAVGRRNSRTVNLLIHLKMTGQLIYDEKKGEIPRLPGRSHSARRARDDKAALASLATLSGGEVSKRVVGGHPSASWVHRLPDSHTRVVVKLSKGVLFFNDMRVFGWMKLVTSGELGAIVSKMPPDIVDNQMTESLFFEILQGSGRAVKVVVMDSTKIGGVGNIYANDGLFHAGVDPRRRANSLTRAESDRLLASLKKVTRLGIRLGGATASDDKFVQTTGLGGRYQERFLVYEQEGKMVSRRGKKGQVEKIKLGGRGTYWVPGLQS